ncbi:E3 ubiquitin-protein ligase RNF220-like [Limulus polyphemus]|uniref:E3 ubiquitin-protein ligase RNF220-like n=1 Tax=Limulus polyphemus TaxID=6850 RepID=A0ABM1SDA5_LIMPO|nr:E3 ubiquitin-protein ligase RNF220-like [Limulus polyphemus]
MEHVQQEIENLHKFYRSKEWDSSKDESDKTVAPDFDCSILKQCGTSRVGDRRPPIARWETYLRVRSNRHMRVNARHVKPRRRSPDFFQQEVNEHREKDAMETCKDQNDTSPNREQDIEASSSLIGGPTMKDSHSHTNITIRSSSPKIENTLPETELFQIDENADPNKLIDLLQDRLQDLQKRQQPSPTLKCHFCQDLYKKPVVSVCCWHVHCERCWLQALGVKRVCPQCDTITFPSDLRMLNV